MASYLGEFTLLQHPVSYPPNAYGMRRFFLGMVAMGLLVACTAAPAVPLTPSPTPTPEPRGEWVPVGDVPVAAWSAALLPTGKVLLFQNGASMVLFDPQTRRFSARFASQTNLFCAGLAFLADGRLLAAGGHQGKEGPHFLGVRSAEVFDPWQERWTRIPDMAGGERWYPTAITLPDGRVLVASGTHAGRMNETVEVLNPERMEWRVVANQRLPSYPWAAVMPGGEVLFYGPQRSVALFDPAQATFRPLGQRERARSGGAGVLLNAQTGKVLALGGGQSPATQSAELLDPGENAWRLTAPLAYPRSHPNAVLLPDGRMLVVGGAREAAEDDEEEKKMAQQGEPMSAEVYDPERESWQELEKALYGHGYHSTALLLPDGSVLAAGPLRNLEIYRPWYFAWQRPILEETPSWVAYGQTFLAKSTEAAQVAKVVVMRLSSVTHSLNTDQRYLELGFASSSAGLSVKAPSHSSLAPPGYYLLFLVTAQGIPSEGKIIHIR